MDLNEDKKMTMQFKYGKIKIQIANKGEYGKIRVNYIAKMVK